MKKLITWAGIAICVHLGAYSQYYFSDGHYLEPAIRLEAGVFIGAMNCLTDLGGKPGPGRSFLKDLNWSRFRADGGIFISGTYQDIIGLRLEFCRGMVTASDADTKNNSAINNRYLRNLHFRSRITEFSLQGEMHPLKLIKADHSPLISPYLIGGIGLFQFNPKAKLDNKWVELHPLRTEGQGFPGSPLNDHYALLQSCLIFGGGVSYELSAIFILRFELLYRFLQTDYLDDVSGQYIDPDLFNRHLSPSMAATAIKLSNRTGEIDPAHTTIPGEIRGNAKNNDGYFSLNLKFGIVLNRKRYH